MHKYMMLTAVCTTGTEAEIEAYAQSVADGYRPPVHDHWPEALKSVLNVRVLSCYSLLLVRTRSCESLWPGGVCFRRGCSRMPLVPDTQSDPLARAPQACWAPEPGDRPCMNEVVSRLAALQDSGALSSEHKVSSFAAGAAAGGGCCVIS